MTVQEKLKEINAIPVQQQQPKTIRELYIEAQNDQEKLTKLLEEMKNLPRDKKANSLYNWCLDNDIYGLKLLAEFNYERNLRELGKNIHKIAKASSRNKVQWVCSVCNYEWSALPSERTRNDKRRTGCPECNRVHGCITGVNDLLTWCKQNGSWGEQLIREWDTEKNRALGYEIDKVARASANKVYWRCEHGHEWTAQLNGRTTNKLGCPHCNNIGTSYGEQLTYRLIKEVFPEAINRYQTKEKRESGYPFEIDIYIPSMNIGIEYQGGQHNSIEAKLRDEEKKAFCQQKNIRIIEIWEAYNGLDSQTQKDTYCVVYSKRDEQIPQIINKILKEFNKSLSTDLDLEQIKKQAYSKSKSHVKYEDSVLFKHPVFAREILDIDPKTVTAGMHRQTRFKCNNCGNIWESTIHSRTMQQSGCKKCGYNSFFEEQGLNQNIHMKLSIAELHPLVAKEFVDQEQTKLTMGSQVMAKLKCRLCGRTSEQMIYTKMKNKYSCRSCGFNSFKQEQGNEQSIKGYYKRVIENIEYQQYLKDTNPQEYQKLIKLGLIQGMEQLIKTRTCPVCEHINTNTNITEKQYEEQECEECGFCKSKLKLGIKQTLLGKYKEIQTKEFQQCIKESNPKAYQELVDLGLLLD